MANEKLTKAEIIDLQIKKDEASIEEQLYSRLNFHLSRFNQLKEDRTLINNPDALGSVIARVVWEQFINQIGVTAGEEFIKENRGLNLDLRTSSHIQTTENFAKGKIATHNTSIDYQERYDSWQSNFQRDSNGNIIKKLDIRSGEYREVLKPGARSIFDRDRPKGSASVHMDHTVPAAEIIRSDSLNAHLSKDEQVSFANSKYNLNPLDSSANESKGDSKMREWLNSLRFGKRPADRFPIDEKQLLEKDDEARAELAKREAEGIKRSVETGRKSQLHEAFLIGKNVVRAVVMRLLADLLRSLMQKFIMWMRQKERSFESFKASVKEVLTDFVANLRKYVINATDTAATTIATAIIGPVVDTLKKVWIMLKQGYNSVKNAISYLKGPESRNQSFGENLLVIGKMVITDMTVAGSLALGEGLGKSLLSVPGFGFQIPLFGSLASIIGIFLGALISGLCGALAINAIERIISKKQLIENTNLQIETANIIIDTQKSIVNEIEGYIKSSENKMIEIMPKRYSEYTEKTSDIITQLLDKNRIPNMRNELDGVIMELATI